MAVKFDNIKKTFTLHTSNSTYQMKIDRYGVLLHTYYGSAADDSDFSYLIVPDDHGFSGQIGDAGDDRTYSMDFYPLEYAVYGNGDYRVTALRAGKKGSVPSLDLRYVSHEIRQGKYELTGLPALFANVDDTEVETLEIVLKDRYEDAICVRLLYGVFEKQNVITRAVVIENQGGESLELHRAMSMSLDFLDGDMEIVHLYGKHAGERQFERKALVNGITEISSSRGNSSHQHNPSMILCKKDTTEEHGGCYGFSLLYSGSFRMIMEREQFGSGRIVCGLSDEEFVWELSAGEQFITPEVVMAYSEEGFSDLSQKFHQVYQQNLIRSLWKNKKRPLLVNNWEATYFDFTSEKLLAIAQQAADLGLDMLVLDDGWFGNRSDDRAGLGDWYVNEEKLGCTLNELVDAINGMGLKFGIWIEPEMVNEDSDLYREHPQWVLQIPGREPNRSRCQLVLDLSNPEVVEYLKECLRKLLDSANIEYVKWDVNRCIDNVYSAVNCSQSQGAIRHRYILGLYELQEYVFAHNPNLLLEGCNGGGGRYDAGMLYYVPQIWCSDNSEAVERLRIHYGTSFVYPMSTVAAHVSACPNHQNGRVVPFKTRGVCAMQGSFGYELDLSKLTEEEKCEAKKQIAFYHEHWELIQKGAYYRLNSPFENRDYTAWSYVAKDGAEALLSVVYTDLHANPKPYRLKMKGLCSDAWYDVDGKLYSGTALMLGGIVLPRPRENYDSFMVYMRRLHTAICN